MLEATRVWGLVFEGVVCGESRDILSFVPNLTTTIKNEVFANTRDTFIEAKNFETAVNYVFINPLACSTKIYSSNVWSRDEARAAGSAAVKDLSQFNHK